MATTVKVRVLDGWAVYDGHEQRSGGAELDVPAKLAAEWEQAGWVERVPEAKPPARGKSGSDSPSGETPAPG